jgi:hypothetical protein
MMMEFKHLLVQEEGFGLYKQTIVRQQDTAFERCPTRARVNSRAKASMATEVLDKDHSVTAVASDKHGLGEAGGWRWGMPSARSRAPGFLQWDGQWLHVTGRGGWPAQWMR